LSSFLQFEWLVRPFLTWSAGADLSHRRIRCRMEEAFSRRKSDRLYFLPVVLQAQGGCVPVEFHGSAHLHALGEAQGFAEMPVGKTKISKGEEVDVRLI
jgi:molybdopterin molybdotransferase